jgi:hypothetical protein
VCYIAYRSLASFVTVPHAYNYFAANLQLKPIRVIFNSKQQETKPQSLHVLRSFSTTTGNVNADYETGGPKRVAYFSALRTEPLKNLNREKHGYEKP